MFSMGQKQYGESIHHMSDEELRHILRLFKNKFWGRVDSETWKANDEAVMNGNGEIKAIYIAENGTEIHFFRFTDCSFTAIASVAEINKLTEKIKEAMGGKEPRRRSGYSNLQFFS